MRIISILIFTLQIINAFSATNDSLNLYYKNLSISKSYVSTEEIINKIENTLIIESKVNFKNLNKDSLKGIHFISNKNNSLAIFTYDVLIPETRKITYKGYVFYKQNQNWKIIYLKDTSQTVSKFETFSSTEKKWLGCIYYDGIELQERPGVIVLLAANFNSKIVKRKWIEGILVDNKGIRFGEQIFENMNIKRYMLQYSPDISVSLKFDEKRRFIIFDHLVPKSPELKNQYQYYVNDLSYDAFEIKQRNLVFKSDVDARNPKSKEDKNLRTPK